MARLQKMEMIKTHNEETKRIFIVNRKRDYAWLNEWYIPKEWKRKEKKNGLSRR